MRSLTLLDVKLHPLVEDDARVTGIALDPSTDSVYAVSERRRGLKIALSVYTLKADAKDQVRRSKVVYAKGTATDTSSLATHSILYHFLPSTSKLQSPARERPAL